MKTGFSYSHQNKTSERCAQPLKVCVYICMTWERDKVDCVDYKGWKADTAGEVLWPLGKGDNSARDKSVQLFKRPALQGMAVHDNKRTNTPKYKSMISSKESVCLV